MSEDVILFLMGDMKMGQRERVVTWLQEYGSLTHKEAFDKLGIVDLPKRISELINEFGLKITKEVINSKNRFGHPCRFMKYSMEIQKAGWINRAA